MINRKEIKHGYLKIKNGLACRRCIGGTIKDSKTITSKVQLPVAPAHWKA